MYGGEGMRSNSNATMPLAKLFEFHNVSMDKVALGSYHADEKMKNSYNGTPLKNTTHKRYYQHP